MMVNKREKYLNDQYNLPIERYRSILANQNGVCAICMKRTPKHVDHDHMCCTGPKSCGFCVRGLLCVQCNTGLGMFNDNHMTLARAKRYVFDYRKARGMIKTNSRHKEEVDVAYPELPRDFGFHS